MRKLFSIGALVLALLCVPSFGAAANCTVAAKAFTIETSSSQFVCTLTGQNATITNTGSVDIEIGWNSQTIGTAGTQIEGQFTLKVGMTVPTNMMTSFSFKSASAGQIVYFPFK